MEYHVFYAEMTAITPSRLTGEQMKFNVAREVHSQSHDLTLHVTLYQTQAEMLES